MPLSIIEKGLDERLTKAERERDAAKASAEDFWRRAVELERQRNEARAERDLLRAEVTPILALLRSSERAEAALRVENAALLEELTQLRRVTQQVAEEPPPVKEDFQ